MTYAPQIISMNDTTRYNFFYQNSLLHKFIDNDERKATQDLCSKNIKDLTKDQLLNILYVDGDPQKGKNHVYPFILVRNNGRDIPYPMELIAQKRNDLFSIYKEYINGFLDDINKQITRSGILPIESIEELLYDQDKNNLCHIAAKVNNVEAIDIFPHWMTEEPDCNDNIPIYVAASYGNKEVAVRLFKGRTNKIFNRDEETPARIAIKNKQIDTALALIEVGDQVFLAHSRYEKNEILKEWLTSLYPDNEQAFVRTFQQLLQAQETTMKYTLRAHREYLEGIGIHPLSVQIEQTKNKKSSSDTSVMSKEPQTPVTSMTNGTEEPALQAESKPKVETTFPQPKNSIMETVTPKQQSPEQENSPIKIEPNTKEVTIKELRQNLKEQNNIRNFFAALRVCQNAGVKPQVTEKYVLAQQERLKKLEEEISTQRNSLRTNTAFENTIVRVMCGDFTLQQLKELSDIVQAKINGD